MKSVAEVLAIADKLERAAAAQYTKLGQMMRRVGHNDVAAVFESLAAEEQQHVESVARLAHAPSVAPGAAAVAALPLPAAPGTEEMGSLALLTPYKALSVAVQAEEKAFSFWTYVASTAVNDAVRLQAESMARQELVHAAKLRHARRKAYRDDPARLGRCAAAWDAGDGLPRMRASAERLAHATIEFLSAAAVQLETMSDGESAGLLHQVAADLRAGLAREVFGGLAGDDRLMILRRLELSAAAGPAGILFDAAGRLELLMERYLDLLGRSGDARATDELQAFGGRIARSTSRVNARLYAVEPDLAGIASGGAVQRTSASA